MNKPCKILSSSRGIALLTVLWVMVLLTIMVAQFAQSVKGELQITSNLKQDTQGYYLAWGGINYALAQLGNAKWEPTGEKRGIILEGKEIQIIIDDEASKININLVQGDILVNLLLGLDIPSEEAHIISDSILDWRDPDDLYRPDGAEDDYYSSLSSPYPCKNGKFDTVEELLLVKGVTRKIFYGKKGGTGLINHITVHTASTRLNINTVSRNSLLALPGMDKDKVDLIFSLREEVGINHLSQLQGIVGHDVYRMISPHLTLKSSPYWSIEASAKIPDSPLSRKIAVIVKKITINARPSMQFLYWKDRVSEVSGRV